LIQLFVNYKGTRKISDHNVKNNLVKLLLAILFFTNLRSESSNPLSEIRELKFVDFNCL